jgi:hypothetical protein
MALRYAEHVRQDSFPFGCRGDLAGYNARSDALERKRAGASGRLSIGVLLYTWCLFDPAEPC